jgi:hypothetical protein
VCLCVHGWGESSIKLESLEKYLGEPSKKILLILSKLNHLFCQIELVVTFPQAMSKDELAHFSTSKYVGSYQIQVEREAVLSAYTARTFKVIILKFT